MGIGRHGAGAAEAGNNNCRTDPCALTGPDLLKAEYLRIRPMLEQFIRRRLRRPDMAEDFLNDLYLRLDRVDDTLTVRAAATSYLYRAAINLITDDARKAKRHADMLEVASHEPVEHGPSCEDEVMARSDLNIVAAALSELPAKAHEMLVLSRVHGMTNREIAGKMDVSASLVEKYIARALAHCRERLQSIDQQNDW
jgi:RNA polymerase sigma factor (sigma-70 family)